MRYGSVCSGIEAATVAWHPLGWQAAFVSEIEAFPCAALAHHYPEVPNLGDFTKITADAGPVDLLVGGTPCQSFSVAGKRLGLDDPRGNLAIEFLRLAVRLRARWVVFENVPGFLSSGGGRDFGAFLGLLGECGYGFAYRVLDAQYVGGCPLHADEFGHGPVPQRRRRVFVVAYSGSDWRPPAAVLFESDCLRRDSAPGREAGEAVAALTRNGVGTCGADDNQGQVGHLNAGLHGEGHDASDDGTGRGVPLTAMCLNAHGTRIDGESETFVPMAFEWQASPSNSMTPGEVAPALKKGTSPAVFEARYARNGRGAPEAVCPPLKAQSGETGKGDAAPLVMGSMAVRRITPVEAEFLQGFPRDYTRIPYRGKPADACPDGPRHRALGNSMAVPVMRWIGERIEAVEGIIGEVRRAT